MNVQSIKTGAIQYGEYVKQNFGEYLKCTAIRGVAYLTVGWFITYKLGNIFQSTGANPLLTPHGQDINMQATATFCVVLALLGGIDFLTKMSGKVFNVLWFIENLEEPLESILNRVGDIKKAEEIRDARTEIRTFAGLLGLELFAFANDYLWYRYTNPASTGNFAAFILDSVVIAFLFAQVHTFNSLGKRLVASVKALPERFSNLVARFKGEKAEVTSEEEATPEAVETDEETTSEAVESDEETTPEAVETDEETTSEAVESDEETTPEEGDK